MSRSPDLDSACWTIYDVESGIDPRVIASTGADVDMEVIVLLPEGWEVVYRLRRLAGALRQSGPAIFRRWDGRPGRCPKAIRRRAGTEVPVQKVLELIDGCDDEGLDLAAKVSESYGGNAMDRARVHQIIRAAGLKEMLSARGRKRRIGTGDALRGG